MLWILNFYKDTRYYSTLYDNWYFSDTYLKCQVPNVMKVLFPLYALTNKQVSSGKCSQPFVDIVEFKNCLEKKIQWMWELFLPQTCYLLNMGKFMPVK